MLALKNYAFEPFDAARHPNQHMKERRICNFNAHKKSSLQG